MKDTKRLVFFMAIIIIVALTAIFITHKAYSQQATPQQQVENLQSQIQEMAVKIQELQEIKTQLDNRITQYNRLIGQGQIRIKDLQDEIKAAAVPEPKGE